MKKIEFDEYLGNDLEETEVTEPLPEETVTIFGKKINAVLFEMITGIIVFGFMCQMTIVWFLKDKLGFSLGLWLGIITAVGYTIHMWWSLGQYLPMGAFAQGIARKHAALRYLVVGAILIIVAITNAVQFLAVFLGIMGVKAGAFLQPFIQSLCRRK
jgi:hypothetical protein